MGERQYGVVDLATVMSESGLDFLQGIVSGRHPNPPMARTLGFHLAEVSSGRAVFEGVPQHEHYNPIGTVHGGFAATLLDSALACAIFSTTGPGEAWTTVELKINLVRALTALKDADGRLYAHATTTCMIFPGKG